MESAYYPRPLQLRQPTRPAFPVTVVFGCEPVFGDSLTELNQKLGERHYQLVELNEPVSAGTVAPSAGTITDEGCSDALPGDGLETTAPGFEQSIDSGESDEAAAQLRLNYFLGLRYRRWRKSAAETERLRREYRELRDEVLRTDGSVPDYADGES